MTIEQAKTLHDGATVSLRGGLIDHKGDDRYVFRDKSGEINVIIPSAVFDGREVQPDQMININGSLDKKAKEPLGSREPTAKITRANRQSRVSHTGHAAGLIPWVL